MSEILLTAVKGGEEDNVISMCESIGSFMDAKIECEKVFSIRVKFPDNRPDILNIFKRLAGDKTGLNMSSFKVRGKAAKKLKYGEPGFVPDPLGS
jgi:hypothetical protein